MRRFQHVGQEWHRRSVSGRQNSADRELVLRRPIARTDFDRPAGRRFEHRQKTCKAGCDHCQAERREEPVEQGYACKTPALRPAPPRSEEHTSELQSLMRISYAVLCLKKKKPIRHTN